MRDPEEVFPLLEEGKIDMETAADIVFCEELRYNRQHVIVKALRHLWYVPALVIWFASSWESASAWVDCKMLKVDGREAFRQRP